MVFISELSSEISVETVSEIREKPYAYVVSAQFNHRYCAFCFKNSNSSLQRCSKCRFLYYCDTQCQKDGWSDHRDECRCLVNVSPKRPTDVARLMARIIFKQKTEKAKTKVLAGTSQNDRTIDDLMTHRYDIISDPFRSDHFATLAFVLKEFIGDKDLPSQTDLINIFGKILVNAFSILDVNLNPIGTGLYIRLSELDHSCNPDTVVVFEGCTAVLRPLNASVSLADLSQVKMSYIDLMETVSDRRRQLKDQYYFDCSCTKCLDSNLSDKMDAYKCQECSGPSVSNSTGNYQCGSCGNFLKESDVAAATECVQNTKWELDRLENFRKESSFSEILKACNKLEASQNHCLHELNVYRVKTLDFLFDACIELEQWAEAAEAGKRTLPAYRLFYPENYPNLVLQLAKVGKILVYIENLEEAGILLSNAVKMGEVCFGKSHATFIEIEETLISCKEELRIKLHRLQQLTN